MLEGIRRGIGANSYSCQLVSLGFVKKSVIRFWKSASRTRWLSRIQLESGMLNWLAILSRASLRLLYFSGFWRMAFLTFSLTCQTPTGIM